jgi:hypothetical protein
MSGIPGIERPLLNPMERERIFLLSLAIKEFAHTKDWAEGESRRILDDPQVGVVFAPHLDASFGLYGDDRSGVQTELDALLGHLLFNFLFGHGGVC